MKKCVLLSCCFLWSACLFAGGEPYPVGARALGMGNASVTFTDAWSLFSNPAGLADVSQMHGLFAYDNRFNLPGMHTMAAGFVCPSKYGSVGISINRFGDDLYSEHLVGLAYSHRVSNVRLGAKVNYVQIHAGDLGTRSTIAFEFGGVATITPELSFGAHVYNFNQAKVADYQDERIPTVMKAGLSYKPIRQLLLCVEAEKDVDYPATVKAGLEYEIVRQVHLRTGISTKPSVGYFGVGFSPKQFQVDYAVRTHPTLGLSHHVSFAYRFGKIVKSEK